MEITAMVGPWQIVLILMALGLFALPIIALVDIVQHEFTNNNKIVWLLIVLLLPLAGAVLYFILGRRQHIKSDNSV